MKLATPRPAASLLTVLALCAAAAAADRHQEQQAAPEPEQAAVQSLEEKSVPEDADAVGRPRFDPEAHLKRLGIELPTPPAPVANYVRAVRTGNLVFLAGHGPLKPDGGYVTGKVGRDLTVEQGYEAARLTGISLLASLKAEIGDLSRVRRIVRVEGMVNSTPEFTDQPKVINGCSDLLVEVFGERGRHARAAVGMASLPIGIAVEIKMVVQVE